MSYHILQVPWFILSLYEMVRDCTANHAYLLYDLGNFDTRTGCTLEIFYLKILLRNVLTNNLIFFVDEEVGPPGFVPVDELKKKWKEQESSQVTRQSGRKLQLDFTHT